jgi:aldehyde dehydrogenase (NAD+)
VHALEQGDTPEEVDHGASRVAMGASVPAVGPRRKRRPSGPNATLGWPDGATVSSLIAGRAREDAPGGTQDIPNPARLDEIVATVGLAEPRPSSRPAPQLGTRRRDWARGCRRPCVVARSNSSGGSSRTTPRRSPDHDPRDRQADRRGPGSVQEVVDTCNFFVSEGRRLYGMTVPSSSRQAAVHVPQPGRRRGDRHGGQLPGRRSRLVPGRRCSVGTRRSGSPPSTRPRLRGARQLFLHAGFPEACSTWCSPMARRRSKGSRSRSTRPGRQGRVHGSSEVGRRLGELCGRHLQTPCSSSAARTRSS